MKDYAKSFYLSQAWKKTREAYLKSKGYLCEECMKEGKYVPADTVHHIIHISEKNINDRRITLDPNNLEAVCRDCHAKLHRRGKRFKVDELGRVIL